MIYAEVILPIAGPCYTFSVGEGIVEGVKPGCAVSVQFGRRKIITGVVRSLSSEPPPYRNIKPVLELLYPEPVAGPEQLELWEWMARYYMCSPGEVMRAAMPGLLKPSGLSDEEFAAERFKPRTVRFAALSPAVDTEERFHETCEKLRRAPKQYKALMELAGRLGERVFGGEVPAGSLSDGVALRALAAKGIVVLTEREAPENISGSDFPLPPLTEAQKEACEGLRRVFESKEAALLFGVPSSGKSEVCFHLIADTLAAGRDALMLLPEISLTTQFVKRISKVFGGRVAVYHSGMSDRRRAETYMRLMRGRGGTLVVGARSALFLPVKRPGLIVVDEEQDTSYKQQDPAPRYNARDSALVAARLHGAKVVLSSATPSLETWTNALSGKYGLVRLAQRYGDTMPPEVVISDTLRAVKRGERRSHFNKELLDALRRTLERGEQAILFQNRRGTAPYMECGVCGKTPRCGHCGIPMTAHRNSLRCHYCGAAEPLPVVCPSCGGGPMSARGFGTEKIEDELARIFPLARVMRLDRDTAGSEAACNRIITEFEQGRSDILVGTQMVTKGLDFAGVSLVGILNADNLLNYPDFRSSERAYQLIAQVAGRAGRRGRRGEVIIQTADPGNRVINQAAAGDYDGMAADILAERAAFAYPPYSRLVSVLLRHRDKDILAEGARKFGASLRPSFGELLLGPQQPVVERIRGEYALIFLLKVVRGTSMEPVRDILKAASAELRSDSRLRGIAVTPDVDPV